MASRYKARKRSGKGQNSVALKVDMGAVNALVRELKGDMLKATRPAAQAAAQVFYQAALQNVAAIGRSTGKLAEAIYQVFSEDESKAAGEGYQLATYHISWNAKKAPHGHLVEYGHLQKFKAYIGKDGKWYTNKQAPLPQPKQIAAHPFIRPAFNRQAQAVEAAQAVLLQELDAS